jgi:YgiT-type zinc finger domain-containing protein
MSNAKEDLRSKLVVRAEAAIDKLLADERLNEQMTLSEIEALVGVSEVDFSQGALEEIMTIQHDCPTRCLVCEGKLRNKGKRKRRVVTLRGETVVERNYYQCEGCGKGYFPPR